MTWTFWAVFVSVLGVAATLIAPRLSRVARLAVNKDIARLGSPTQSGDIRIEIYHGQVKIDQAVYNYNVSIENSGSKDITNTDFIDPIYISGSEAIHILTADAQAGEGVDPQITINDGRVLLNWKILKPKEVVQIRGIARLVGEDLETDRLILSEDNVNVLARLRDVRIGKRLFTPLTVLRMISGVIIFWPLLIAVLLLSSFSAGYVYTNPVTRAQELLWSREKSMFHGSEFKACNIQTQVFAVEQCRLVDAKEYRAKVAQGETGTRFVGVSRIELMFVLVVGIIFAIVVPMFAGWPLWVPKF